MTQILNHLSLSSFTLYFAPENFNAFFDHGHSALKWPASCWPTGLPVSWVSHPTTEYCFLPTGIHGVNLYASLYPSLLLLGLSTHSLSCHFHHSQLL